MANGFNMETFTHLGALGAVVVVAGIIFMAISKGGGAIVSPPGVAPTGVPPVAGVTDPFLYRNVSNAMYGKKGCGCGK